MPLVLNILYSSQVQQSALKEISLEITLFGTNFWRSKRFSRLWPNSCRLHQCHQSVFPFKLYPWKQKKMSHGRNPSFRNSTGIFQK